MRERDELLGEEVRRGLDARGERRLTYVRWQLSGSTTR
jgi:hypothetical protein